MAETDQPSKFPKVPPFITTPAVDTQTMLQILGLDEGETQTPPVKPSQAEIEKRATQNMQAIQANLLNGGGIQNLTDAKPFGDEDRGKVTS